MGRIKRLPQVETEDIKWRALDIPKSEWIELYMDLYKQVFGETTSDEEAMGDAEKRRLLLFHKSPKPRYRK